MSIDPRPKLPRVLVVVGDDPWGDSLVSYLRNAGLHVEVADRELIVEPGLQQGYEILLIDVQLAAGAGLAICRRLAHQRGIRIIALGTAADDAEGIVALELGADDYVVKTTQFREILARIRARARRLSGSPPLTLTFTFSGFTWDLRRRRISAPDGTILTLSSCEIALLVALLQSGGRELSREELRDFVVRDGVDVSVRAIDSHVSRLRRKLAERGGTDLISTVYGVGYRWTAGEEPAPPLAAFSPAPHAGAVLELA